MASEQNDSTATSSAPQSRPTDLASPSSSAASPDNEMPFNLRIYERACDRAFDLRGVKPSNKILYIKQLLHEHYPVPTMRPQISSQRLLYGGRCLRDDETLASVLGSHFMKNLSSTSSNEVPTLTLVVMGRSSQESDQASLNAENTRSHAVGAPSYNGSESSRNTRPSSADVLLQENHAHPSFMRRLEFDRYPYKWHEPSGVASLNPPLASNSGQRSSETLVYHKRVQTLEILAELFGTMLTPENAELRESTKKCMMDVIDRAALFDHQMLLVARSRGEAGVQGPPNSAIDPRMEQRGERQDGWQQQQGRGNEDARRRDILGAAGRVRRRQLVFHFELNWMMLLRVAFVIFILSHNSDRWRFYVVALFAGLGYLWYAGYLNSLRRILQIVLPTPNDLLQAMFPHQVQQQEARPQQQAPREDAGFAAGPGVPGGLDQPPNAGRQEPAVAMPRQADVNAETRDNDQGNTQTEQEQPNRLVLLLSLMYSFIYGFVFSLIPAWSAETIPNIRNWLIGRNREDQQNDPGGAHNAAGNNVPRDGDDVPNARPHQD